MHSEELKASLIISVYKDVHFLEQVMKSLELQTWRGFEVIISEDGDSLEMRDYVRQIDSTFPIQHLTQEDLGWRKNRALNRAIKSAKTEWLVFIDGDCVLHPRFMEFHFKLSNRNSILAGKRIKLDPETSNELIEGKLPLSKMNRLIVGKFRKISRKGGQFVEEGIFIDPTGPFGFIPKVRKMRNLKGCNMSFHRSAIEAINGFNEDYIKPAVGEDIDLVWRFQGLGFHLVSLRNLAVQYHLYHKESWIEQEDNMEIMRRNQKLQEYVCKNGLEKK
ncbi:glycosyltransferase [Algoriphagus aquimarinus]|uniref:Glycosyltransferase n=1 Tax=Algoriphagus aquimarinus TaxID=237018 RepID=A0A5C7AEJ4_9BACT|nr:glycosyltransferase [Algoriphagus aquimarinus]TXE06697.1 glycosyltransferase [Algoriphagus aquimarinus]